MSTDWLTRVAHIQPSSLDDFAPTQADGVYLDAHLEDQIMIGRSDRAQIQLNHVKLYTCESLWHAQSHGAHRIAAMEHAFLRFDKVTGAGIIRDNNSGNGTYVRCRACRS